MFEEDAPQYKVGRMEGDMRRYWRNRPLAQRFADEGQRQWPDTVYSVTVQYEPNHGFVAILYAYHSVPEIREAGYEIKTPEDLAATETAPANWAAPQRPSTGSGGGSARDLGAAPVRGATARVWAIADEVGAQSRADRQKVIDACVAEGINKSTAATQWSKYAKSKGW